MRMLAGYLGGKLKLIAVVSYILANHNGSFLHSATFN